MIGDIDLALLQGGSCWVGIGGNTGNEAVDP
jgi:hypothetical protein